ncbi:MAG: ABC transporter ATP-binding protein, partial [Clostridiaceae bacterium]|nr:ABC transporter ATP-binding protein [Clostridiaceae bacterium]
MSLIGKYIKNYWKLYLSALIFLVIEAFCDLMQPTIMSDIIDIGVASKDINYVLYSGGKMLAIAAIGAVAAISRNIISSNVSQRFGCELRSDLFKKIQFFSFDNIDKFEPASLITRLTNDITQVQHFVHGTMRIFVKAPILCIGSFVMAWLLNPRMTIVLLFVVPIIATLIILSAKIGYPFFTKVQKAIDNVNAVTREYLSGVRVVKAFNRFDYERERFEESNRKLASLSTTTMRIMSVFGPGMSLTVNLGIVAVLWLGGRWVNYGQMHVGKVIAFINYMTQLLHSLMMISFVFNMFVRAKASTSRIKEVFSQENTIPEHIPGTISKPIQDTASQQKSQQTTQQTSQQTSRQTLQQTSHQTSQQTLRQTSQKSSQQTSTAISQTDVSRENTDTGTALTHMVCDIMEMCTMEKGAAEIGAIETGTMETGNDSDVRGMVEFDSVFFSYESGAGEPVIKGISFTCMPGETIGIIGSTGSGKTTLVNLIPRFYDVSFGAVKVDGIDVKDYSTRDLRNMIAIVPQKTILFTGTIAENIRWGKEDATFEEVMEAAMIAQAHDFISAAPEEYNTLL